MDVLRTVVLLLGRQTLVGLGVGVDGLMVLGSLVLVEVGGGVASEAAPDLGILVVGKLLGAPLLLEIVADCDVVPIFPEALILVVKGIHLHGL